MIQFFTSHVVATHARNKNRDHRAIYILEKKTTCLLHKNLLGNHSYASLISRSVISKHDRESKRVTDKSSSWINNRGFVFSIDTGYVTIFWGIGKKNRHESIICGCYERLEFVRYFKIRKSRWAEDTHTARSWSLARESWTKEERERDKVSEKKRVRFLRMFVPPPPKGFSLDWKKEDGEFCSNATIE